MKYVIRKIVFILILLISFGTIVYIKISNDKKESIKEYNIRYKKYEDSSDYYSAKSLEYMERQILNKIPFNRDTIDFYIDNELAWWDSLSLLIPIK